MLKEYFYLMRLHKPIGIFLLLWPTLWALWLASKGHPDVLTVAIFVMGVILMRSAGCVINDFADQKFDGFVARTRDRPLVTGKLSKRQALVLFVILLSTAFLLVLCLNRITIILAIVGALLTIIYPFMKRYTYLPQVGLGLAFAWGVPMAFAAVLGKVSSEGWVLFFAAAIWPIIYDTFYAMVDRADDIKVGIKSTAILFNNYEQCISIGLQLIFLGLLILVGIIFKLTNYYFLSLALVILLFAYQQWLIKDREPEKCFSAFLNNHWVGVIIFIGILL